MFVLFLLRLQKLVEDQEEVKRFPFYLRSGNDGFQTKTFKEFHVRFSQTRS